MASDWHPNKYIDKIGRPTTLRLDECRHNNLGEHRFNSHYLNWQFCRERVRKQNDKLSQIVIFLFDFLADHKLQRDLT